MATQYTSILKLALPTTGELSGTWGDVVNDNITSMVEEAVAGRAVINSWTANAHTLTTANGTTSESRCAMLELTDTGTQLTGAGEVICPTASKIYIVKNAAGQTITIKPSAGTGVAIANGQTKFVFCDGTNVVEAVTSIATLDATTGNITTVNATTVDTTSIEVTNIKAKDGTAAGSIADSTGVVTLASVVLTTADINGGSVDGVTLGTNSAVTEAQIDNININGNTISSTDTDGNVVVAPNGTGDVQLDADTVRVGDSGVDVTITTNGTGDLILNTNAGTNSGTIRIYDGSNGNIALTPNGTGEVDITKVDIDGGTIDGVTIGGASAGAITGTTITGTSFVSSGNMTFGDGDKAIFGAGSDLQIYHDGSNSIIKEDGTGDLEVQANRFVVQSASGADDFLIVSPSAGVDLRHNVSGTVETKLATTATGIDVTGTVTADGLTVEQNAPVTVTLSNTQAITTAGDPYASIDVLGENSNGAAFVDYGARFQVTHDPDLATTVRGAAIRLWTGFSSSAAAERLRVSSGGDISFYEDTGTTPKFFWDASTERLGIGNAAPTTTLDVTGGAAISANVVIGATSVSNPNGYGAVLNIEGYAPALVLSEDTGRDYTIGVNGNNLNIFNETTSVFTITDAGSVGIGTTSPSTPVHASIASATAYTTSSRANIFIAQNTTAGGYAGFEFLTEPSSGNQGIATISSFAPSNGNAVLTFGTRGGSVLAERLRIDSSGNVGIGTSAPTGNLTIGGAAPAIHLLETGGSAGFNNTVLVRDADSFIIQTRNGATFVSSDYVMTTDASGATAHTWRIGNAEKMRINSSGNVGIGTTSPSQALDVVGSIEVSGGIYLGGTTSDNLLDDYEIGTWTGKVADAASGGNESPTIVNGAYTKIGRVVYVQLNVSNIDTTGLTAGSDVYITGLPFATRSVTGNAKYTGTAHFSNVTFSDMPFLNADESATVLRLLENRSGLGVDFVTVSELSSGTADIHGNICYETA